jgi:hypothetical protein
MRSANGKNKVFHQSTAPSSEGLTAGDIWFDTANDNRINTWTGSAWSAFELGEDAIANASITNAKIANATIQYGKIASLDMGTATTGKLKAQYIDVDNLFAQEITATNSFVAKGNFSVSNPWYTLEAYVGDGNVYFQSNEGNMYIYGQSVTISAEDYRLNLYGDDITLGDEDSSISIEGKVSGLGINTIIVQSKTASISVGKNSTANDSFSVSKSGYTPLGIVGWQFPSSNSSYMFLPRLYLSGTNCYWLARNTSGNDYSGTLTVYVLYVKN